MQRIIITLRIPRVLVAKQLQYQMIKMNGLAYLRSFSCRRTGDVEGHSLFVCLKCPKSVSKTLSCNDKSRQNLKRHIAASSTGVDSVSQPQSIWCILIRLTVHTSKLNSTCLQLLLLSS